MPKAIDLKEAIKLFEELADREDLALNYLLDGCYARAHIMCRHIENIGLKPLKAWAFEEAGGSLHFEFDDEDRGFNVKWWYHVALSLDVELPDGNVEKLVFDPVVFDGPATLGQWRRTIHAKSDNVQICDFGVAPRGHSGDYFPRGRTNSLTDRDAMSLLKGYSREADQSQRVVLPSDLSHGYFNGLISQRMTFYAQLRPSLAEIFAKTAENHEFVEATKKLQGKTWISETLYKAQMQHQSPKHQTLKV